MKILRVNSGTLETRFEELPADWKLLGGRGLSAKIMKAEVPPQADPLGPEAKLIIAAGPLAGTLAPSCGRTSVGGKSPLTRGIKEANAGGPVGQDLDKLGIRAIVLEGQPEDDKFYILSISKDGALLKDGEAYRGLKTYALSDTLRKEYHDKISVISIGPVGERKSKSATVTFTDKDGHCSRHAARGGLGAVMMAKGLKAIVIDDQGASSIEYNDRKSFQETLKNWAEVLKSDKSLAGMSKYGTPGIIVPLRSLGSMPSRNYSSEPTEGFEALAGPSLDKINQERKGRMDGCMPGCLVRCSVVYNEADGTHLTSSYEYETLALMGTNLGIADPDAVARFDRISDDLGIDTIELGSALGVAASAGKMEMGNVASALALFDEVEKGTEFGRVLADGVVATAKLLGVTRIPAFKGQAIPAHDPRVTKATGVTYHTSPMGADHTAGVNYENPMAKEGQVERSLKAQIMNAMMDSLGYCILAVPADKKVLITFLKDLINARFGLKVTEDELVRIGRETLRDELTFNEKAGFIAANDPPPDFVRTEPLAPTQSVFDIPREEVDSIWNQLDTIPV
jgi:aldehyde:ferredoxin oxidoreductase